MSVEAIDLTLDEPQPVVKKARTAESVSVPKSSSSAPSSSSSKQKQASKKTKPHVLLWICAAGKGKGRNWKNKSLRVIGVYPSKEDAERKKDQTMTPDISFGHGDICVGDTWEDEIDLVVRPVEEVKL